MEEQRAYKSIFDLTPEEFEARLAPIALAARQEALDAGLWFSYRNELCVENDMFIHEFKDGRKELIQLGNETGRYKILKVF